MTAPPDESEKTVVVPRPVFEEPAADQQSARRLVLPSPGKPKADRREDAVGRPPAKTRRSSFEPQGPGPAEGRDRGPSSRQLPIPLVAGPEPRLFIPPGPLTILSVALVVVVGALFVGSTARAPSEPPPSSERVPAGTLPPPGAMRSWQDRYRAEHPELLIGSPKVQYLQPPKRTRVRRLPRVGRVRADGNQWPASRVAGAELPASLKGGVDRSTPEYRDVQRSSSVKPPRIGPLIEVSSIPPQARVELDGQLVGLTPFLRTRPNDLTSARIRISRLGYLSHEALVRAGSDGNLRLKVKLKPDPNVSPEARGERSR